MICPLSSYPIIIPIVSVSIGMIYLRKISPLILKRVRQLVTLQRLAVSAPTRFLQIVKHPSLKDSAAKEIPITELAVHRRMEQLYR